MTQIQGFIKPNRRPGELGVHSLDHFHFVVPDLAVAQHFYGEFGLDIQPKGNLLTVNTKGHPHQWGSIGEGPRKKHSYMSFGAFEDDIDRFAERVQTMGIRRVNPPPGVDSNGSGFTTMTVIWSRSRLPRNRPPTKKPGLRFVPAAPANAGRPSAAPWGARTRAGWRTS